MVVGFSSQVGRSEAKLFFSLFTNEPKKNFVDEYYDPIGQHRVTGVPFSQFSPRDKAIEPVRAVDLQYDPIHTLLRKKVTGPKFSTVSQETHKLKHDQEAASEKQKQAAKRKEYIKLQQELRKKEKDEAEQKKAFWKKRSKMGNAWLRMLGRQVEKTTNVGPTPQPTTARSDITPAASIASQEQQQQMPINNSLKSPRSELPEPTSPSPGRIQYPSPRRLPNHPQPQPQQRRGMGGTVIDDFQVDNDIEPIGNPLAIRDEFMVEVSDRIPKKKTPPKQHFEKMESTFDNPLNSIAFEKQTGRDSHLYYMGNKPSRTTLAQQVINSVERAFAGTVRVREDARRDLDTPSGRWNRTATPNMFLSGTRSEMLPVTSGVTDAELYTHEIWRISDQIQDVERQAALLRADQINQERSHRRQEIRDAERDGSPIDSARSCITLYSQHTVATQVKLKRPTSARSSASVVPSANPKDIAGYGGCSVCQMDAALFPGTEEEPQEFEARYMTQIRPPSSVTSRRLGLPDWPPLPTRFLRKDGPQPTDAEIEVTQTIANQKVDGFEGEGALCDSKDRKAEEIEAVEREKPERIRRRKEQSEKFEVRRWD